MNTLAGLAMATDPPSKHLLKYPPEAFRERLITPVMWIHILVISIYQIIALMFLYYAEHPLGFAPRSSSQLITNTMVFNAFVFCQLFNEFNCRKIHNGVCF